MHGKGLYIVMAVYVVLLFVADAYTVKDVNKLKKALLEDYDKSTAPISNGDLLVTVKADIRVKDVADLDEYLEKLTTNVGLGLTWMDESMNWTSTEEGINITTFDKETVWVPAFWVENRHSQISNGVEESRYLPVEFTPDGHGKFYQSITTETSCNLDTSGFPYDRHTCSIEFEANSNDILVEIFNEDTLMVEFEPSGYWDVINGTIYLPPDYWAITVNITIARKPTFIMVNLILPITMLALLSPLVFLLPNQSGERVGFSITVLLAISVFMTIVSGHVPQKSKPFPLMLTMLFILYSLTVVVVMCVVINARIYHLPDHVRIPRPLIWLSRFTSRVCCCCRKRRIPTKSIDNGSKREENVACNDEESQSTKVVPENNVTWKDIGWTVDMICMALLYISKSVLVVVCLVTIVNKK